MPEASHRLHILRSRQQTSLWQMRIKCTKTQLFIHTTTHRQRPKHKHTQTHTTNTKVTNIPIFQYGHFFKIKIINNIFFHLNCTFQFNLCNLMVHVLCNLYLIHANLSLCMFFVWKTVKTDWQYCVNWIGKYRVPNNNTFLNNIFALVFR